MKDSSTESPKKQRSDREKLIAKIMKESRAEPEILRRACASALASGVSMLQAIEDRQAERIARGDPALAGVTADEMKSVSAILRSVDKLATTLGLEVPRRSRIAAMRAQQAQSGALAEASLPTGRKAKVEAERQAQAERPQRRLRDLIEAKQRGISVEQAMAERIAAEKGETKPDNVRLDPSNVAADAAVIGAMTPEQRLDALLAGRRT